MIQNSALYNTAFFLTELPELINETSQANNFSSDSPAKAVPFKSIVKSDVPPPSFSLLTKVNVFLKSHAHISKKLDKIFKSARNFVDLSNKLDIPVKEKRSPWSPDGLIPLDQPFEGMDPQRIKAFLIGA